MTRIRGLLCQVSLGCASSIQPPLACCAVLVLSLHATLPTYSLTLLRLWLLLAGSTLVNSSPVPPLTSEFTTPALSPSHSWLVHISL
ncbi:hypothetical protein K503DRAFT_765799, partial [Rhizopogon vinicolor AM-OR11-026]